MELFVDYFKAIMTLIPVFSALACMILLFFSLRDCLSQKEKKLKWLVVMYLLLSGAGWFCLFCYIYAPSFFVWINVLCMLVFILPNIFFYRIIHFLTRINHRERFYPVHYFLPCLFASVMLAWQLFVPFHVSLAIVENQGAQVPSGYELYQSYFSLKPLLRLAFGTVYYVLSVRLLVKYYRQVNEKKTLVRRPAGWVLFLFCISLATLISSLMPSFVLRSEVSHSIYTGLVGLTMAAQHILLSYHIIRRDYRLFVTSSREASVSDEDNEHPKTYSGKLTCERLEDYVYSKKPFLNSDYRITELADALNVSRSMLSAFINQTYGVSFNRFMNRERLREVDRLRSLPSNKGKTIGALVEKAGFGCFRNYSRAVSVEKKGGHS